MECRALLLIQIENVLVCDFHGIQQDIYYQRFQKVCNEDCNNKDKAQGYIN